MSLNLAECTAWTAAEYPENTALIMGEARLSYRALYSAVQRVANLLEGQGLGKGDRIALMLPNVPQFVIAYHGILHMGGTIVPLNPLLKAREIAHYLEDSGAKAMLVWQDCIPEVLKASEKLTHTPMIIAVEAGLEPEKPPTGESFMTLMMQSNSHHVMAHTRPEDLAVIQYTSALKGTPRGAMLTHFNLWHNTFIIREKVMQYYPEDVCMAVLPFFHTFGQTTMMNGALMSGSSIVLAPRFEAPKILDTILKESVTLLAMVPTMFRLLTDHSSTDFPNLPSLRAAITGGAPMPQELADAFTERFQIPILEGYGLTETSPVVAFNYSYETNRPGSVGPPIYGCRLRILRADKSLAETGEVGEVAVHGPNLMQGYLNDPEGTAESFHDGWFLTGDLGYLDADGYLFLTGLKKDMIIRAGMNVYPREVELVLLSHPEVTDAAVFGIPDRLRGEEVLGQVVLVEGGQTTGRDLVQYCREHLSSYKCPRRIEPVATLPKRDDGVLDKAQLRSRATTKA